MSIKVTLDDQTTREIPDVRISTTNLDSKYKVQAVSEKDSAVTVIVKGSSDAVEGLDVNTLKATVDLSGYTKGEYEVEVKVTGDDLKLTYESKTKKVKVKIDEK